MWGIHCAGQGEGFRWEPGLQVVSARACRLSGLCDLRERQTARTCLGEVLPRCCQPWIELPLCSSFSLLLKSLPMFTCFSKSESDLALSRISLQAYSHIYISLFSKHLRLCAR